MKAAYDKAIQNSLVLIHGPEGALRRVALDRILAEAGIESDDFDLQYFDGESDPQNWLGSAGTAPFLAARRTVVVRHLLRCDPEDAKGLGWSSLPPYALLVLVQDDEMGDEARLKTRKTAWEKLVIKAKGFSIACSAEPSEFRQLIKDHLEPSGKKLSERALEALKEMSAGSVSRALEELPKLVSYVGEADTIQEDTVRTVVLPSREWNVFKLVDAAVEGDAANALRQLRILVTTASKAEEAAFRTILPNLSKMLRLIWQARACFEAGVSPASETAKKFLLSKPNLASEQQFVQSKAIRAAHKLDFAQLTSMLEIVAESDARLKGLLPSFSAMESLEQMVLRLVGVVRTEHSLAVVSRS